MRTIVGCLLSLYKFNSERIKKGESKIDFCKLLASQDGLTTELIEYLSQVTLKTFFPTQDPKISKYTISLFEIYDDMIKKLVEYKQSAKELKNQDKLDEDEDKLCPICCTYDLDRSFEPCNHSSCHR